MAGRLTGGAERRLSPQSSRSGEGATGGGRPGALRVGLGFSGFLGLEERRRWQGPHGNELFWVLCLFCPCTLSLERSEFTCSSPPTAPAPKMSRRLRACVPRVPSRAGGPEARVALCTYFIVAGAPLIPLRSPPPSCRAGLRPWAAERALGSCHRLRDVRLSVGLAALQTRLPGGTRPPTRFWVPRTPFVAELKLSQPLATLFPLNVRGAQ